MRPLSVIWTCPYVPPEWVEAHALRGRRVVPSVGAAAAPAGACPFAWGLVQTARGGDEAVIVSTLCDAMRRSAEWIERAGRRVFLLHVPRTWEQGAACPPDGEGRLPCRGRLARAETPGSSSTPHRGPDARDASSTGPYGLYLQELRRLGEFLTACGGTSPSPEALAAVMDRHDRARRAAPADEPAGGVPLAIVGGPRLHEDAPVLDRLRSAGGRIVLDATETGALCRPRPFDRRAMRDDPLEELAWAYFALPHPARRPHSPFHSFLRDALAASGARGIILWRYVWCDTWAAEAAALRRVTPLPVLELDAGDRDDPARRQGRLEAFIEVLRPRGPSRADRG